MSEFDYRYQDLCRRVDRAEAIASQVPVIVEQIAAIRRDLADLHDSNKSVMRALYTTALSIVGGAVLFFISVVEIAK